MENRYLDVNYWKNELDNFFPDRDSLSKDDHFVIFYINGGPMGTVVHHIMNFVWVQKMFGYVMNVIIRTAVCDAIDLDFDIAMTEEFDKMVDMFLNSVYCNPKQEKLIKLYQSKAVYRSDDGTLSFLKMLSEELSNLTNGLTKYQYGFEIVKPENDLVKFWEEFFMLDREDEDENKELKNLARALKKGDIKLLEELISNHC